MRAASTQLKARLASETTSLCRLWRVTRDDGTVLRFTDAVRPVTIQVDPDDTPEVYRSDITFTSSAIFTSNSLANMQSVTMTIVMDDAGFSEGDLRARKFDGAASEVMVCDYAFPEYGVVHMFEGLFGTITISNQKVANIEVQPADSSVNGAVIGNEKYSQTCRANLGDARCKIDMEPLKLAFTVDSVNGGSIVSSDIVQADGAWALGYVKWTTGANAGRTDGVASNNKATTSLFLTAPPFYPIQDGDTGEVFPGCDKLRQTCKTKFNNVLNMRAEPDVPEGAGIADQNSLVNILTLVGPGVGTSWGAL